MLLDAVLAVPDVDWLTKDPAHRRASATHAPRRVVHVSVPRAPLVVENVRWRDPIWARRIAPNTRSRRALFDGSKRAADRAS